MFKRRRPDPEKNTEKHMQNALLQKNGKAKRCKMWQNPRRNPPWKRTLDISPL